MKVWRDTDSIPKVKNAVLTIGTFDGVHLGHQKLLERVNRQAKELDGESVLMTFHPHPRTVINSGRKIALLSTMDEKIDLLRKYGLQNLVIIPFTRSFSQLSPEDYVSKFLVEQFNPSLVVIGYDHKFGKNRVGNFAFLKEQSERYQFEVEEISKQEVEALSISSTDIRQALSKGEVKKANLLLGHSYFLRGVVVKGKQLGKQIGYPTCNVLVSEEQKLIPTNGVYAIRVILGDEKFNAMLNIGNRPTVNGEEVTIEAHIFDFDRDVYGEKLELQFVEFLRSERKFDGLKELSAQLALDKISALEVLT